MQKGSCLRRRLAPTNGVQRLCLLDSGSDVHVVTSQDSISQPKCTRALMQGGIFATEFTIRTHLILGGIKQLSKVSFHAASRRCSVSIGTARRHNVGSSEIKGQKGTCVLATG
eukprot:3909978-Amphidinium_carterae.3